MVFVAGQVAEDGSGNLVGAGDMVAQSRQVFANLGRALKLVAHAPTKLPNSQFLLPITGEST